MTTNPVKPLLEVKNVHAVYGRKIRALKGVSVELHAGEIVALIGNNGAGKTTMLKTISGILTPESGEVLYQGRRISGMEPHRIARLGIAHVPEGRHVFPRLTVMENLEMGAYCRKEASLLDEYRRIFDLFPLLGRRRAQLAGTLSGGEQQMLAMGRALMASPKLLMLDEPSMGLSPALVDKIFDIIRKINQLGTPIFLVEQNARKALQVASRGYVLETGNLALSGSASNLLHNKAVRHAYLGIAG
ncbi:MAG: ABC transporter ATP-binding protein [Elusimicrobia bacterium]|nr:ABC transporter ATP-binding protein [Elusimicrobiota bacterium]